MAYSPALPSRLSRVLARQLAAPRGPLGQVVGAAMDLANRRVTARALSMLEPGDGEWILDAGCGTGYALAKIAERSSARLVGVDPSQTMIDRARKRLGERAELYCRPVEAANLDDASFEAVLALNVLYFDRGDASMARSLRRLLRPGGRMLAYVTERGTMERWAFTRAGRHRLYDRKELHDLLVAGGFLPGNIRISHEKIAPGVFGLFALATC